LPKEDPEDFHPNKIAMNFLKELIKANKGLVAQITKGCEEKKQTESS
jgi:hypothetical protein